MYFVLKKVNFSHTRETLKQTLFPSDFLDLDEDPSSSSEVIGGTFCKTDYELIEQTSLCLQLLEEGFFMVLTLV